MLASKGFRVFRELCISEGHSYACSKYHAGHVFRISAKSSFGESRCRVDGSISGSLRKGQNLGFLGKDRFFSKSTQCVGRDSLLGGSTFSTTKFAESSSSLADERDVEPLNHDLPNVVDVLQERGLLDAVTSPELRQAAQKPLQVYCGFDPTAESLHLGNLLGIIVMAWFQRCGHTPVALLGGATARVGDPSGKSLERPLMDEDTIARNLAGIQNNLTTILRVPGGSGNHALDSKEERREEDGIPRKPAVIVNNYDWWRGVSMLEFLRDVGKYARVGTMMAKESVKKRLASEDGMSYTEFTYQLLQGYDFVHLYRSMGVVVQLGGSDQWGNITAGTELVRRLVQGQAYGLTWPLLLKSDGSKFGKSEGGAVWLAPSMLSPYKFFQYLYATPDADVIKFMKMLTFVELDEIARLEAAMKEPGYVPNTAQRQLASEVTRFVHGEVGVQEALKTTEALMPGASTQLNLETLEGIAEEAGCKDMARDLVIGMNIVDLVVAVGLFPSKGAAKRSLKQGGLYLNNAKISNEVLVIQEEDAIGGKMILLASGKKNKMLIRIA